MNAHSHVNRSPSRLMWIDEIPKDWDQIRGKRVFRQVRTPKKPDDEQLSATQKYGVVPQNRFMEQEGSRVVLALSGIDNFRHVDKDDFVISLRSFQGGIERCHYDGCVSPAYTILKKNREISEDFFGYLLKCDWFVAALQVGITGIREGKNVSYEEFGDIILPFPKVQEQTAIARFLDRETGRIDGLIEKKTRFITLLKEKRAAVITHAVTKGVPRINGKKAPSEAGHLEDTRLDQIFSEVTNLVPLDGIDLLTPSVVHGVVPQASLGMRPQQALRENYRVNLAQPDDFVISLSSHAHGIEHCGLEGGVSPDYTLLRPKCDPRLIPFLRYALKSSWIIFQLGAFKTGVRMGLRLTWNKVRYCKIGLPSPDVAGRIANYLDGETARIDGLITLTERSIDLLREKRAALITAAVTGKIDVRAAA